MRYLMTAVAAVIAASVALFVVAGRGPTLSGAPAAPVDFSGRWTLTGQETRARGGKGRLGNHEEPVTITHAGNLLSIQVESADPAGRYQYDTSGQRLERTAPGGKTIATTSQWDGSALVTTGKRLFTSPGGADVYVFEERRELSADGTRMTVETRIDLWFDDLYRTSVYTRSK